jgi:hypothetical protein
MGVYADFLASARSIDTGGHDGIRIAGDKAIVRQIRALMAAVDPAYPSGFEARNEVQSIAIFGGSPSGGTFTLSFTLKGGTTFTTAGIAHNANAATIQGAINTAATAASVPGWANGDIVVTGGPLTTTPITLTYSGASVASKNHGAVSINAAGVTGGTAGAVSTTTHGQSKRLAWAVLRVSGCISSDPPAQGTSPSSVVAIDRAANPHMLDQDAIRDLAREASIEDESADVYTAIVNAFSKLV